MLTKQEVIKKGKKELGRKNPLETFNYWMRLGLLPKPEVNSKDKRFHLFPEYILDVFKQIRDYQKEGLSLAEIKERFDGRKEQRSILEMMGIPFSLDKVNITLQSLPNEKYGRVGVVTPDGIYVAKTEPFNIFLLLTIELRIIEQDFLSRNKCTELCATIMENEGRLLKIWDVWNHVFGGSKLAELDGAGEGK